jgi:outer membrane autotransporter protein
VSAGGVAAASPSRRVIEKLLLSARDEEAPAPTSVPVSQMTRDLPELDLVQSLNLFGSTKAVGLLNYESATRDASAREVGFDSDAVSAYGGVSFALGRDAILGVGAEVTRRSGTLSGFLDGTYAVLDGDFDATTLAPSIYYSTGILGRGYLQIWSAYAFVKTDGSKQGFVGGGTEAQSSVDGRELSLGAQTIFELDAGRLGLSPQLGLEYVRQWTDGFAETWVPGPIEVRFDSDERSSLQSALGLGVATAFRWRGATVQPYVALDWIHEFLDDARTISATIDGTPIEFQTDQPDGDWFELSAEMSFALPNGINASVAAEIELDHRFYERAALFGGVSIPLN